MAYTDPVLALAAVMNKSSHTGDFQIVQVHQTTVELRVLITRPKWWQLPRRLMDRLLLGRLRASVPGHIPLSLGFLKEPKMCSGGGSAKNSDWWRTLYVSSAVEDKAC